MTEISNLLPTVPDPTYVAIVAGTIRGFLQLAAGLGLGVGAYTDSQIMIAAGLIVGVSTLVWSGYQKMQAAKQNRDSSRLSAKFSAQESARAGEPVPVIVTAAKEVAS